MRVRSGAALVATLVVASAAVSLGEPGCQDCPPFPVPRAEAEFAELLDVPRGFASGGKATLEEVFSNWSVILALALGGLLAAPIGAWACRHVPVKPFMVGVGVLVCLLSIRILIRYFHAV